MPFTESKETGSKIKIVVTVTVTSFGTANIFSIRLMNSYNFNVQCTLYLLIHKLHMLWLKKYPWFTFQFYSLFSNLSSYCTVQTICQKQRKHDIWTMNTNLRKPWWTYTYYTKPFEKINYSLKVSGFLVL